MAVNIGTLQAFIVADNSGLLRAVKQSNAAMARTAKRAAEMSAKVAASFDRVGKSLTLGVTLPIVAAGTAMAKAAIDAEETANKFAVVFSTVRGDANAMAEALRNDFGLARTEARQLLSDTADLLSGFGFTQEAALDLSNQVNELAVDLASFTNIEGGAQRASAALTKALLGERESAKELGIAILEADVKAKVLQLRQQGLTFDTERQAKAYATLQIALEQSKNAIGDFERSQASTANQLRILWARTRDVGELLGTAFIPKINQAADAGIRALETFSKLNPEIQSLAVQIALAAAVAGPAAIIVSKLAFVVSGAFTAFSGLLGAVGLLASPLGAVVVAAALAVGAFVALVGPIDAAAIAWDVAEKVWSFFVEQVGRGVKFIVDITDDLKIFAIIADTIGNAWFGLRTALSAIFVGLGVIVGEFIGLLSGTLKLSAKVAAFFGLAAEDSLKSATDALDGFKQKALDFAKTNADVTLDTAADWKAAMDSVEGSGAVFERATREAFTTMAAKGTEALEILRGNAADKAEQIRAIFDSLKDIVLNIRADFQVTGLPGQDGGIPDPTGIGGMPGGQGAAAGEAAGTARAQAEWEAYARVSAQLAQDAPESVLQDWFDQNAATLDNFKSKAADTWESFASGFSDAVGAALATGKNFKSSMVSLMRSTSAAILSQVVEMAIAQIAIAQTETVAKGMKDAPHVFLIPVFAALALSAFAAGISGTAGASAVGGSVGGGGGGGAAIAAPAEPKRPAQATVIRAVDAWISEGEGNQAAGGGSQVVRVEIDDVARGNLMSLIVDETRNGAGDGSGTTLALEGV